MAESSKQVFLGILTSQFGPLRKIATGNSLFQTGSGVNFYVRYSKVHDARKGFFGLKRDVMLRLKREGGYVCFICEKPDQVYVLPIKELIAFLGGAKPAYDDSYKVQIGIRENRTRLYSPGRGSIDISRFLNLLPKQDRRIKETDEPDEVFEAKANFTHEEIQLLMVKIGKLLGYDVWVPMADRGKGSSGREMDRLCVLQLDLTAPQRTRPTILSVDIIWLKAGTFTPVAFFEIEHSTSMYSGLLRLNDILIDYPIPRTGIVSYEKRRSLFEKEIARRTFQNSGLDKLCKFYNYRYVHTWHSQLQSSRDQVAQLGEVFFIK